MLVSIMKRNFTILYDSSARETPIKKRQKPRLLAADPWMEKCKMQKKKKKLRCTTENIVLVY